MRLLKAKVRWFEGCSAFPRLQVLVNSIPACKDMTYHRAGNVYFGECLGFIDAFHAVPDYCKNARMFRLADGTVKGLSIQPSYIDDVHLNGIIPGGCISCGITDSSQGFESGNSFISGIIAIDLALEAIELLNGVHLLKVKIPVQTRVTEIPKFGKAPNFELRYTTMYMVSTSTDKVTKKITQRHHVHNGEELEEAIVVECLI